MKKKAIKIVFFLMLLMIIAIVLIQQYILKEIPITERLGNIVMTSVSLRDSLHIKTFTITKYFSLLNQKEYEKAYQMLTDEYKRYMPYEKYVEEIKNFDTEQYEVKKIKQLSSYAYVITLEEKDTKEETNYLAYINKFNDENFTLSPNGFVYYEEINKKKKSQGLEVTLQDYVVREDSIQLNMTMENHTNQPITVQDVKAKLTISGTITDKFEEVTIGAKEKRKISVLYDGTNYYIPKAIYVETPKTTIRFEW